MDAIKFVQDEMLDAKSLPEFHVGDNVSIRYRIVEGDKERVQTYKGDVIQIRGKAKTKTFTVRKMSGNGFLWVVVVVLVLVLVPLVFLEGEGPMSCPYMVQKSQSRKDFQKSSGLTAGVVVSAK